MAKFNRLQVGSFFSLFLAVSALFLSSELISTQPITSHTLAYHLPTAEVAETDYQDEITKIREGLDSGNLGRRLRAVADTRKLPAALAIPILQGVDIEHSEVQGRVRNAFVERVKEGLETGEIEGCLDALDDLTALPELDSTKISREEVEALLTAALRSPRATVRYKVAEIFILSESYSLTEEDHIYVDIGLQEWTDVGLKGEAAIGPLWNLLSLEEDKAILREIVSTIVQIEEGLQFLLNKQPFDESADADLAGKALSLIDPAYEYMDRDLLAALLTEFPEWADSLPLKGSVDWEIIQREPSNNGNEEASIDTMIPVTLRMTETFGRTIKKER